MARGYLFDETDSADANLGDRYVVSIILSLDPRDGVVWPEQAAGVVHGILAGDDEGDPVYCVFDRDTGRRYRYRQSQIGDGVYSLEGAYEGPPGLR